ncbi:MAG: NTP transferase domain-containing protein [Rhizobiaceae bacterium]
MKFGSFALDEAVGGVMAHSLRLPDDSVIRKGVILTEDLIDLMHAASLTEVMVAISDEDDVHEDEAALRIASLFKSETVRKDEARTGRVNFFATTDGLFQVSREIVDRINAVDPGVTFATLHSLREVNKGRMVATIKIIPYFISSRSLEIIETIVPPAAISVSPYKAKRIGLIFTLLPGLKSSILEKTRRILEHRLGLSGSEIVAEKQVSHRIEDVAEAVSQIANDCDLVILFGATAISDINDVIPSAIEKSGGKNMRFGMPVDPGNLLLLSELHGKPVLGAPGCARSPAENGFDWALQRILADVPLTSKEIAGLGVGGLLMETGARPHPREKASGKKLVTAIVLAAGQSRRMGEANKMIVDIDGNPMIRHVVEAALTSNCDDVLVVTGHEPESVREALSGLDCRFVHNEEYNLGLSTSLATGIKSSSAKTSAAVILLGDMPWVTSGHIDQLVASHRENRSQIIMATSNGKRGNPVLWPAGFFAELQKVQGDVGARHVIGANSEMVLEVELGEAASLDVDTPTALQEITTPSASKAD